MLLLRSFKLRFVHRHVRIEIEGTDAGVDLLDAEAGEAFALAGPLLAAVAERAPGSTVRALSVDPRALRLIASIDPPGAIRIEGESLRPALDAVAPLLAHLEGKAKSSLLRREVAVRASPSAALTDESSLVLSAVGVPHRVEQPAAPGAPFTVLAPEPQAAEARAVLAAFEEENKPDPIAAQARQYGESAVGLVFALLVVATHAAARFVASPDLLERGTSDAELILGGQWWRTATALTLHADAAHAGGNALFGAIAVTALAHRLGPAAAAWITLAAGVLANGFTALAHRSGHVAIGSSGAVFGAFGALAVAELAFDRGARRGRPALALAASAALLALLGTAKDADLLAHAFGMISGMLLGAAAALAFREPPRRSALQPVAAAGTILALAACWWIAARSLV